MRLAAVAAAVGHRILIIPLVVVESDRVRVNPGAVVGRAVGPLPDLLRGLVPADEDGRGHAGELRRGLQGLVLHLVVDAGEVPVVERLAEALRLAEVHAEGVDHDAVAVGQLRRRVGRGLARHGGHVAPAAAGDLLLRAVGIAIAGLDLGLRTTGQLRLARGPVTRASPNE